MAIPWADTPYKLLLIPGEAGAPFSPNPSVAALAIAMANVHNALLRGLNAIYLQAPFVHSPTDISDFMLYIRTWADTVHGHHTGEEEIFFPRVTQWLGEVGADASLMDVNVAQHKAFEAGMQKLSDYVGIVSEGKDEFDGSVLRGLIDGFGETLRVHLEDEIGTLLGLGACDGKALEKAMKDTVDNELKTADPHLMVPLMMGCIDKGYPGSKAFPPVPFFVPWLNAYWYTRKHRGCWRFNPSDHWGRPRPLLFHEA